MNCECAHVVATTHYSHCDEPPRMLNRYLDHHGFVADNNPFDCLHLALPSRARMGITQQYVLDNLNGNRRVDNCIAAGRYACSTDCRQPQCGSSPNFVVVGHRDPQPLLLGYLAIAGMSNDEAKACRATLSSG